MEELVSVIIPAYNAESYIFKAIQSILNQTYTNFEIIITDDCSTDSTYEVISAIEDSRIFLYQNHKNAGVAATLNNCILNSKGEFIAVMHADDIAMPERLQKQVSLLNNNKNIDVIGSNYILIDEKDDVLRSYELATSTNELLLDVFLKRIPFPHPSVMYRSSTIRKIGYYKPCYDGMEDHDLWLRLSALGYKFSNVPMFLMRYRQHASQVSQNYTTLDLRKNYDIFFDFIQSLSISRNYIDTVKYCDICIHGLRTNSQQDLRFFLDFFTEIVDAYPFLTIYDKNSTKNKLFRKVIQNKSKKSLSTFVDILTLLKWRFSL